MPVADTRDADPELLLRLWEAAREGDQAVLLEILMGDDGEPPHGLPSGSAMVDEAGLMLLHVLALEGHASAAQWLIDEAGAEVNATAAKSGMTALHFAALKGKAAGGSPSEAATSGYATMASLLLHRGASAMASDAHGVGRHADVCSTLLGALSPEQLNATGPSGETALHRAAYWGHEGVVSLLVQAGADTAATDASGRRPYEAPRARMLLVGASWRLRVSATLTRVAACGDCV
ncbi:hypothetical protein EMIHUDRAFT_243908 [Emiliania huxleyi CCMP1516]|uniref:Ankyrin repeat protein n=2 Tax=Emiliania huxleyi TaxID=2903 RepID=A0A0D3J279_EMIH1|nr:hypothetical protein EMIHUDRAFT_243908 [Emiliania huxleyi CCMP1516]EOD17614.1 hypothetical protein EMIHUDRAFT_243908 [Emiliania huxleyi CCMP1516]|eukprot:XP_005770043.1 hypothetical protein EMIHUDRAFT_243908 [Emiliania huxleyi CCMP1516]